MQSEEESDSILLSSLWLTYAAGGLHSIEG